MIKHKLYFAFIFFLSFCIIVKNYSLLSLGSDEIILYTIPAYGFMESDTLDKFLNTLLYGFFYEDHLNPILNIFSPLIGYAVSHDILPIINVGFFLLVLLAFYFLALEVTESKKAGIYLVTLASSNIYLNWYLATSNFSFLLSLFFQILTILFTLKAIKNNKKKNILLLLFFAISGTLSFENFFLCYFAVAVIFVCKVFDQSNKSIKFFFIQFKKNILVPIILFLSLFPYFILHHLKFGTILPSSRASGSTYESIYKIVSSSLRLINETFFGVLELVSYGFTSLASTISILILFTLVGIFLFFKSAKSIFSRSYLPFFIGLALCLTIAGITGRYHTGLWSLCWFLFVLISYAPFDKSLLTNKSQKHNYIFLTVPLFVLLVSSLSFFNSTYMQTYKKTMERSYFLDSAISHIDELSSNQNTFLDLSSDNAFHPIRVILSNRTAQKKLPAKIISSTLGSQPLGSSITFSGEDFLKNNNIIESISFLNQKYNQKAAFIFDQYILTFSRTNQKEDFSIYQWYGCGHRVLSSAKNHSKISINKDTDDRKIYKILELLKVELNGANDLDSIECLPLDYSNKVNSEKLASVSSLIVNAYKNPCRLAITYGNNELKSFTFINKNQSSKIYKNDVFPASLKSLTLHINPNKRLEKNIIANNENELNSALQNICRF